MPAQATDRPAPARILVIDDDPTLLMTLARILASEGFQVDVATNGAEGLARVRGHVPALVLLDLHMPVLDGYGFLDAFRAMPACATIPVILATAERDRGTARQRTEGQGVVLFMPKPLDLEVL